MLTKCANPGCSNHFLYMNEGKVYRFETRCATDGGPDFTTPKKSARRIEFFWLCSNCAAFMTLTYRQGIGVGVLHLGQSARSSAA